MAEVNELMARIKEDMDVYSSNDEKIGEVGQVVFGSQPETYVSESSVEERDYFEVKRGFLGMGEKDIWLDGTAIKDVADDRVTLQYTKDEINDHSYNELPRNPEDQAPANSQQEAVNNVMYRARATDSRSAGGSNY